MPKPIKIPRTYRLSQATVDNLAAIIKSTGTSETAAVEMAVALLRQKIVGGKMNNYGSVKFDGITYNLLEQATLSNRVFPGWWGDTQEGEEYQTEYEARAEDSEGNQYVVYWQFKAIKGSEPEDDSNYPWDDTHITRVMER